MSGRFRKGAPFNGFTDIYDREKALCSVRNEYVDNMVNLLNDQSQKIMFLKKRLAYYEEQDCSKRLSEMGVELDFLKAENFDFRNKIDSLKLELEMCRTTIGRNEAYINLLKNQSQWDNKSR